MLSLFGAHVDRAFGHVAYHVGSSLTEKSGGWRDVDVRLLLPDDEFDALFGEDEGKLLMWNLAWSALGREMTRLPIDFQFQRQTDANAEFSGPRSALVVLGDRLPTVG